MKQFIVFYCVLNDKYLLQTKVQYNNDNKNRYKSIAYNIHSVHSVYTFVPTRPIEALQGWP